MKVTAPKGFHWMKQKNGSYNLMKHKGKFVPHKGASMQANFKVQKVQKNGNKSQRSLKKWTKQKWRTKSGKPSGKTGERYLPEKAIKSMSAKEYAATTRKKREDTKKGKQHSKQPKKIAKKTKRYRT